MGRGRTAGPTAKNAVSAQGPMRTELGRCDTAGPMSTVEERQRGSFTPTWLIKAQLSPFHAKGDRGSG